MRKKTKNPRNIFATLLAIMEPDLDEIESLSIDQVHEELSRVGIDAQASTNSIRKTVKAKLVECSATHTVQAQSASINPALEALKAITTPEAKQQMRIGRKRRIIPVGNIKTLPDLLPTKKRSDRSLAERPATAIRRSRQRSTPMPIAARSQNTSLTNKGIRAKIRKVRNTR